jgi:hypothetical protein
LFWYFPNPIRAFQCDTDASTHLLSAISDRPPYRSQGNTHISFLQDSSCAATITYNIDFDAFLQDSRCAATITYNIDFDAFLQDSSCAATITYNIDFDVFLQDSSCAATITYNIDFDAIPELNCDVSCVWLKRGGHV